MEHLTESERHDAVDDPSRLSAPAAAHLTACALCAADVAALRRLLASVRALPREMQPPAHTHAAIRAATAASAQGRRMHWSLPAAAAVVLVVASSMITAVVLRVEQARTAVDAPAAAAAATDVRVVAQQAVEQSYADAVAELERAIAEQRTNLAPATLQLLQSNLRTIDAALAEARAALAADPGNAMLNEMLRSGYERKLDVLRSVGAHAGVQL